MRPPANNGSCVFGQDLTLNLAVTPVGPNGKGANNVLHARFGEVASDGGEMTVRYLLSFYGD